MADNDDVNKSDKPVNGKHTFSHEFEKHRSDIELDKLEGHFKTKAEKAIYRKFKEKEQAFYESESFYESNITKAREVGDVNKATQIEEFRAQQEENLQQLRDQLEEPLRQKANRILSSRIATQSTPANVRAETTRISGTEQIRKAVRENQDDLFTSSETVSQNIMAARERASKIGETLADVTGSLGAGEDPSEYDQLAREFDKAKGEAAYWQRVEKEQNKRGLSSTKLEDRGLALEASVKDFFEDKQLKQDVKAGNVGNYEQELGKLSELLKKETQLREDMHKGIKGAAKDLKEVQDDLGKQSKKIKYMAQEGLDEDSVFSRGMQDKMKKFAFYGGTAANMAGNLQRATVGADVAQMNNRSAFMDVANRQYMLAEKAVLGEDVDAMMELATSPEMEAAYAEENRRITHGTAAVGAFGSGVANAVTKVAGGALVGGVPGAIAGGADAATGIIADFSNIGRGNVGAQATFQAMQAMRKLNASERYIRTFEMQKYFNQGRDIFSGAQGLGNATATELSQSLMQESTLVGLAGAGVSPQQAAQMLPILKEAGAMKRGQAVEMINNAGEMSLRGIMGKQEYLGAAARLTAAGASDKELVDIVAKGMDNSKNISQMVDASISMSAGLANIGVSGVGAMQDALSASTQAYVGMGINKNLAVGRAVSSLTNLDEAMKSGGMTFGNIMETAQLRGIKGLEGASVAQMESLRKLGVKDIIALRAGDKEAQNLARKKGLKGLLFNQDGSLKEDMLDQIATAGLSGTLIDTGTGIEAFQSMIRKARSGEAFTDNEMAVANQIGVDEQGFRRAFDSKATSKGGIEDLGDKVNGSQTEITKALKELIQVLGGKKGSEKIYGEGKGFEGIEEMMAAIGRKTGEEFHNAAIQAAKDFRLPVDKFHGAVNGFREAVGLAKMNIKKTGEDAPTERSFDGKDKTKKQEKSPINQAKSGTGRYSF